MTVYRAARDAVQSVWTSHWPIANAAVPVRWHSNNHEQVPDVADVSHWLHLSVEFTEERLVGFGGGRFANDRLLLGSVVIHVFAARGAGEDTALNLLSDAVTTFRSRRAGDLSFIGDAIIPEPGASEDGNWWLRAAIASFQYRFQG
jgi:hypothetical protein